MIWTHATHPDSEISRPWQDEFWPPSQWYHIPELAPGKIDVLWPFDDLEAAKIIASRMTREQFLLWAVSNMTGQVCNGGFTQAFYNSYGQLAEESIDGLRLFGFARHAEIFKEAFRLFGVRPIPRDRAERIERLAILANIERNPSDSIYSRELDTAIFQVVPDRWNNLETEFFELLQAKTHGDGHDAAFFRPLAEWIYQRRDRFFVT
ncbi:hypothetical protein IWQ54_001165 [Labrenzia sp. EL_195]|nr:hypothetical protein [Labrenzia sp. EL_195]